MANFSFTVDTQELAQGLYSVTPHIDGTTGAVIAMQGAVIVAERNAAANICDNVNRGFFSLIRSQISQKMAICRSQVEARLLELRDLSLKLSSVKTTMQRDFQMIAARYTKLFHSLDLALLSRICELDKPLLDLVQKDLLRHQGRARGLQAAVPMHQMESVASSQFIAASATRERAQSAIGAMSRFVQESNRQDRLTASILDAESEATDAGSFLPFAMVELDSLQTRQHQWQYHMCTPPVAEVGRQLKNAIEHQIFSSLQRLEWRAPEAEDQERVAQYFLQLVEKIQPGEKVRQHMTRMIAASQPLALTGARP